MRYRRSIKRTSYQRRGSALCVKDVSALQILEEEFLVVFMSKFLPGLVRMAWMAEILQKIESMAEDNTFIPRPIPWNENWVKELIMSAVYVKKAHVAIHGNVSKLWAEVAMELNSHRKLSSYKQVTQQMYQKKYKSYLEEVKLYRNGNANSSKCSAMTAWQETAMYILDDLDKRKEMKTKMSREEARLNETLLHHEDLTVSTHFHESDSDEEDYHGQASRSSSRPAKKSRSSEAAGVLKDMYELEKLKYELEKQKFEFEQKKYDESKKRKYIM